MKCEKSASLYVRWCRVRGVLLQSEEEETIQTGCFFALHTVHRRSIMHYHQENGEEEQQRLAHPNQGRSIFVKVDAREYKNPPPHPVSLLMFFFTLTRSLRAPLMMAPLPPVIVMGLPSFPERTVRIGSE